MRGAIGRIGDTLAANLWLVPALAFVCAYLLSRGLLAFDQHLDTSRSAWFVYGGSPQGARQLVTTIAGSMITFIGMVFSSTIVVLQLTSSQFSPRIMRSFFRDRIIQGALGTFIATFAYAILVLREIREEPQHSFVPGLSTYVAISLVWLSLAMFVVYINHIGHRIRADAIIAAAAADTVATMRRLERSRPPGARFVEPEIGWRSIVSTRAGVLASVDGAHLLAFARDRDAWIEVVPLPGDFVVTGAPIARIWDRNALDDRARDTVRSAIAIEPSRSMREDALFGMRQLVDVADKALSPGINDPTTAVEALDRLHEILRLALVSDLRDDVYVDFGGVARVVVRRPNFRQYVQLAVEEILLYGRGSIQVTRRLRTMVLDLEPLAVPAGRPLFAEYLARVEACIDGELTLDGDRDAARRLPPATELRRLTSAEVAIPGSD